MDRSIVAILMASSMIALAAPQVAAEDPEPTDCTNGVTGFIGWPVGDGGDPADCWKWCLQGEDPCGAVMDCLGGAPPCAPPPGGPTEFDITNYQCQLFCPGADPDPTVAFVQPSQNPIIPAGAIVVYVTSCELANGVNLPQVRPDGHGCLVGTENCSDADACPIIVVPEEPVNGGVDPSPGVPIPVSQASVCRAELFLRVNGLWIADGSTVFVPCAAQG